MREFDFNAMSENLRMMRKMAPIQKVLKLIPGLGAQIPQEALNAMDAQNFKRVQAIIASMTPLERRSPELLDGSRRARIAAGSGTSSEEVGDLVLRLFEMRRS